jgi:hypothetical protein
MAKALPGVEPKAAKPSRPKMLIFGGPGVGKTWTAIDFPSVFYIDTEGGANLDHYTDKLRASGARYMGPEHGAQDFNTVIETIQTLATTKHEFRTVVIDSFSKLYNIAAAEAAEKGGDDFGRDKKEANKPTRKLVRWMDKLDMNCLLICHEKDKWKNGETVGQTYDGWDKLEYELHLALQIAKRGEGANCKRVAIVRKSRLVGFPDGTTFDWSYPTFAERFGRDVIEAQSEAIKVATKDQVAKINSLIEALNVSPENVQKLLDKAEAERFEEVPADVAQKWIDELSKRVSKLVAA